MFIKENSPPNIWNSFEFNAISRDFNYADYVEFAKRTGKEHALVSEPSYRSLVQIFHYEMAEFYGN